MPQILRLLPLKLLPLALLLVGCKSADRPEARAPDRGARNWVVDPGIPGPDAPPAGQSLFDLLVQGDVPFPFSKLLARIEDRLGGGVRYRGVLIPLGRSLQRTAAAPDFFEYPRAVAAFDAEPPNPCGIAVKDRLFLGYEEKASVIEVLSYNAVAGRFEFQLVRDYRDGTVPRVENASRKVCTACHQNQAPLFSRQLWDETNSNPGVMRLLLRERKDFYGFPIEQSADIPYQIDQAIHRANEFSLYQLLWTEAGRGVRASWLRAMLACRVSGACGFQAGELAEPIPGWRARWPDGLRIPNPEIPNRNPLAILSREGPPTSEGTLALLASRQKNIESSFEPAVRRGPLETLPVDANLIDRVVAGLASWFTQSDVEQVDRALLARQAGETRHPATCTAEVDRPRIELRCQGGFSIEASLSIGEGAGRDGIAAGSVRRLWVGNQAPVRDLKVTGGRVSLDRAGLRGILLLAREDPPGTARSGDGNRIERIEIQGSHAVLLVRRDFQAVEAAIAQWASNSEDPLASTRFLPSRVREGLAEALGFTMGSACPASAGAAH